jgi:hypothetical protein
MDNTPNSPAPNWPERPTPKPPVRKTVPLGLLAFGIICIALGGMGIMGEIWSMASSAMFGQQDVGAMIDEALKGMEDSQLPPEYMDIIKGMNDNGAMRDKMVEIAQKVENLVPMRWAFDLTSVVLSILSLAAGIGLVSRKDWGRVGSMWFIGLATVAVVIWGYAMLPGLISLLDSYVGMYGAKGLAPGMADTIYGYWLGTWMALALMHAMLVVYLNTEKVKRVFED